MIPLVPALRQAFFLLEPLQVDLAVPANTCVFAHVNARGRAAHAENHAVLSKREPLIVRQVADDARSSIPPIRESIRQKYRKIDTQQAHFLLPVAHHAHTFAKSTASSTLLRSSEKGADSRHVPRKLGGYIFLAKFDTGI